MAEIRIEKKKQKSVWPWVLLGAIAFIAVLAVWAALDENNEPGQEYTVVTEQGGEALGAITNPEMLSKSAPRTLDGKELRIDQMRVTKVLGERTFYVTSGRGGDREYLVFLDDPRAVEGNGRIEEGQTVRIIGTVEQGAEVDATQMELTVQEAQAMRDDELYLRAQKLDVRT